MNSILVASLIFCTKIANILVLVLVYDIILQMFVVEEEQWSELITYAGKNSFSYAARFIMLTSMFYLVHTSI